MKIHINLISCNFCLIICSSVAIGLFLQNSTVQSLKHRRRPFQHMSELQKQEGQAKQGNFKLNRIQNFVKKFRYQNYCSSLSTKKIEEVKTKVRQFLYNRMTVQEMQIYLELLNLPKQKEMASLILNAKTAILLTNQAQSSKSSKKDIKPDPKLSNSLQNLKRPRNEPIEGDQIIRKVIKKQDSEVFLLCQTSKEIPPLQQDNKQQAEPSYKEKPVKKLPQKYEKEAEEREKEEDSGEKDKSEKEERQSSEGKGLINCEKGEKKEEQRVTVKEQDDKQDQRDSQGGDTLRSPSKQFQIHSGNKSKKKCKFYPGCKKQGCPFVHPTEPCTYFPNCRYGNACLYVHPNCIYGADCKRRDCYYTHPPVKSVSKNKQQQWNSNAQVAMRSVLSTKKPKKE